MTDPTPAVWSSCHQAAAAVDAPSRLWHLLAVDVMDIRGKLVLAVAATLLTVACCTPEPAAPAPTAVVTVAVPGSTAEAPDPDPTSWERLIARQARFVGGSLPEGA